jgi:hypothetical protein
MQKLIVVVTGICQSPHNDVLQLLQKQILLWRKQQGSVLLAQVYNDPGVAGKSLGLGFIVLSDILDSVTEEVCHVQEQLGLYRNDQVVD